MAVYVIDDTTVPDDLNGAINASVLTVTLTDGSSYPAADFIILINAEEIDIQSRSVNALTVRTGGRGYGDTVAASHADADQVTHVVTNQDWPFRRTVGATEWLAQGDLHMDNNTFFWGDPVGKTATAESWWVEENIVTTAGEAYLEFSMRHSDKGGGWTTTKYLDVEWQSLVADPVINSYVLIDMNLNDILNANVVEADRFRIDGDGTTYLGQTAGVDTISIWAGGQEMMRFIESTTDYIDSKKPMDITAASALATRYVRPMTVQNSAPGTPNTGDLWLDTT